MRQFDVYRGKDHLGRIQLDGQDNGGLFVPASGYAQVRELMEQESRLLARSLDPDRTPSERQAAQEEADQIQQMIMEPGIRMVEVGESCSFELLDLMIEGNRAFWR